MNKSSTVTKVTKNKKATKKTSITLSDSTLAVSRKAAERLNITVDKFIEEAVLLVAEQTVATRIIGPGQRVRVKDGYGVKDLGEGTYLDNITVHVAVTPDSQILSAQDAEFELPKDAPPGSKIITIKDNPKIQLDDGNRIVYGCQVWWQPIE